MTAVVNSALNRFFDFLFSPFQSLDPWFGMLALSALTAGLMLFVYRHFSNQAAIKTTKNRIKAHLLELRLFKDNPRATWSAQAQILLCNFRYLGYSLRPLAVMFIPLLLVLVQLHFRFGYESLQVGKPVILKVKLADSARTMKIEASLKAPSFMAVETPPLRLEQEGEINWRLRALSPGQGLIHVLLDGNDFEKTVIVAAKSIRRISTLRVRKSFLPELLYPSEKPLPRSSSVESIEIGYPARKMTFFGLRLHWLIVFFVFSLFFALALKRPFKVEV